jgi:hypothetical protein
MLEDNEQITVHLGEIPTAISRAHALELWHELNGMYEDGDLDEPRLEIHTVPTMAEMMLKDMAAHMRQNIYKHVVEIDPYTALLT